MNEEVKIVKCRCNCHATGGGLYVLAFLGALVYYLQHAVTFSDGAIGILKALFWPAVLLYKLVGFLGM